MRRLRRRGPGVVTVSASLISLPILSASETRAFYGYIRAEAKESYGVYMHEKSKELGICCVVL